MASDRLARVLARVEDGLDQAVADLARMIATDTRFPPGTGYPGFVALIEELLAPLGMRFRRVTVPEEKWFVPRGPARGARVNLIADWPEGPAPVCSLYFHMDTVCAATGWRRDPLRLTEEGGILYGLGAADMKGAIAAALHALRVAQAAGLRLAYRPQLLMVTDEEGGLYPGIRHLAEQGLIGGHLLNFNGSAEPRIWGGCFGSFNLQVTVEGRAAHSSAAGAAVNAIEAAMPMMQAVLDLRPAIGARVSAMAPPPGAAPLAGQIALAQAEGGTCGGQVPDRFRFLVSRRYPPEEEFAAARAEVETAIRAACPEGVGLHFDLIGHLVPTADPEGPHYPRWQRAVQQGFGYPAEAFAKYGAASASDAGYVQQAGVAQEVILGGLIRPTSNGHGAEEHTTRADLAALTRTILSYLAADFAPDLNPDPLS